MVKEKEYPDDFDRPEFEAWLKEREGEILERIAWEKMEKEFRKDEQYPWRPHQNKPSITGSKENSPKSGSSSE